MNFGYRDSFTHFYAGKCICHMFAFYDISELKLALSFVTTEHPWLQNAKKAPNVPLGDIVRPRLKQFSVMNRFKKKALRVSICNLSFMSVSKVLTTVVVMYGSQNM